MRYRRSNRPTDGPTEWRIESLHATKKCGPRPLSGREPYPIWHDFETIRTPENLAKPAPNWLFKCKFCAQTVSARVERLKKHKKECCGVWSAASVVNDSNAKKVKYRVFRSNCRIMKLCSSQTTEANDFIFFSVSG